MTEQSTPIPDDPRAHTEEPAEGDITDVEGDVAREHSTDPAEGATDAAEGA
ncbi:hypothetical protein [Cellulomonas edaphi]|uniref:Nucleotide exchange factor GrpE n=1 Tax=Cellulomonas edaphi TaxID=3053468 RepID=A0ABT7S375_9CELL|nr:hypothetical protein [Cellulomons edaphi]MDM7830071.1 hypothetical protein [Cellulomons edaphi]